MFGAGVSLDAENIFPLLELIYRLFFVFLRIERYFPFVTFIGNIFWRFHFTFNLQFLSSTKHDIVKTEAQINRQCNFDFKKKRFWERAHRIHAIILCWSNDVRVKSAKGKNLCTSVTVGEEGEEINKKESLICELRSISWVFYRRFISYKFKPKHQ